MYLPPQVRRRNNGVTRVDNTGQTYAGVGVTPRAPTRVPTSLIVEEVAVMVAPPPSPCGASRAGGMSCPREEGGEATGVPRKEQHLPEKR